ncbi:fatty acid cis/trans isomerase [Roseibium aggregatum]|uniref:Fatty acid cis/trans isomerase n=1 Tax=Roseibium aggregatum TaxID=187304 RepID=A0A939J282_9HYPH|nr:fatty acid cis/trans isomerase [Roseibium aggregatum]MBN9669267.1 fatty acid cis/trans isomerase [Roseibium aggregatum]
MASVSRSGTRLYYLTVRRFAFLCLLGLSGGVAAPVWSLAAEPSPKPLSGIQDVLNKRCVVCHGCYDAPCQLKLSSPDGWLRGASKQKVYESSRLEDAPMTRLGIDAKTVPAWRRKGFFSVTGNETGSVSGPSIIEQLLRLGRKTPFDLGAALPDDLNISPLRKNVCTEPSDVDSYVEEHPTGGMPFATAPLPEEDYRRLLTWAKDGSPAPGPQKELPDAVAVQMREIEAFLNAEGLRKELVARYIYEHLFLAHLHLEEDSPDRFFRLIRSRTGPGQAPDEIPSRRPFDDPGGPFHYRLVPVDGTILHKEHMVYSIGPKRLERYHALFLGDEWSLDALPPYSVEAGGNPLSTFAAIPARSRYRFLLDDALFFVRSFIRGPVCYGQVAVNVIEDRFWVSFLDPDADLSVTDPDYLKRAIPILELPVADTDASLQDRLKNFLLNGPVRYQALRRDRYARKSKEQGGPDYDDIWDGDGTNTGARLTIYRNFSSASVVSGFVGSVPETAWVIDFPQFERIYYNLVAGFDVFGNVEHQLATRLYMDSLRREGERMFLSFMPPQIREPMHDEWYRGPLVTLLDRWKESALDTRSPSGIDFRTAFPKPEFLTGLLTLEQRLWPVHDPINRCAGEACAAPDSIAGQLRPLTEKPAPFARFMPDISVLLAGSEGQEEVFTLAHDMAHANVAFIFNEDLRREPEKDSLTVVPGQFSSYPNFVFRVKAEDVPDFVQAVRAIRSQRDYLKVIEAFGLRRTDPAFWSTYDTVQAALNAQDAIQAGLLDLNRYKDPKPLDPIEQLFEYTFSLD